MKGKTMQIIINGKDATHKFRNLSDGAVWAVCDALTDNGYHYIMKTANKICMGSK